MGGPEWPPHTPRTFDGPGGPGAVSISWPVGCCGHRVHHLRGGATDSILDERSEVASAQGMPQFPERLRLDLADALARDGESLANFFERVLTFLADAEPQAKDFLLLR